MSLKELHTFTPGPALADVAKRSIAVEDPCVSWEFEDLSSVAFGLLT